MSRPHREPVSATCPLELGPRSLVLWASRPRRFSSHVDSGSAGLDRLPRGVPQPARRFHSFLSFPHLLRRSRISELSRPRKPLGPDTNFRKRPAHFPAPAPAPDLDRRAPLFAFAPDLPRPRDGAASAHAPVRTCLYSFLPKLLCICSPLRNMDFNPDTDVDLAAHTQQDTPPRLLGKPDATHAHARSALLSRADLVIWRIRPATQDPAHRPLGHTFPQASYGRPRLHLAVW